MKPKPTAPDEPTFEQALAALEALVAQMESADLPLEEVISAYEKGCLLLKTCESRIADARARVNKITLSNSGQVAIEPLDGIESPAPANTADELF